MERAQSICCTGATLRGHAQPDAPTQAACNYAPPRSKLTLGRRACGASTDDKGASATESVACMNEDGRHGTRSVACSEIKQAMQTLQQIAGNRVMQQLCGNAPVGRRGKLGLDQSDGHQPPRCTGLLQTQRHHSGRHSGQLGAAYRFGPQPSCMGARLLPPLQCLRPPMPPLLRRPPPEAQLSLPLQQHGSPRPAAAPPVPLLLRPCRCCWLLVCLVLLSGPLQRGIDILWRRPLPLLLHRGGRRRLAGAVSAPRGAMALAHGGAWMAGCARVARWHLSVATCDSYRLYMHLARMPVSLAPQG